MRLWQTQSPRSGESAEPAELAAQLDSAWQRLVGVTTAMFGSGDIEAAGQQRDLPGGVRPHRDRVDVAGTVRGRRGQVGDFYDGKRQAARYFFRYELPKTTPQLELLQSLDRTTLEMRGTGSSRSR